MRADVHVGGVALDLPHRGLPDGDVELSIRPEAVTFVPVASAPMVATVRKASYLGGLMEYTLDTSIGELFVISTAVERPHSVGSTVGVALAQHGVVAIPPSAVT